VGQFRRQVLYFPAGFVRIYVFVLRCEVNINLAMRA